MKPKSGPWLKREEKSRVLSLSVTLCSAVQCSAVQYSTVQYETVQYSTVQYSTVQYSTVRYSTVQYSTVQFAWSSEYSLCHFGENVRDALRNSYSEDSL